MKPRILAIDDDPVLRRLMTKLLPQAGFEVTAVASGRDALALLEEGPLPDAVVCDLLMPGMPGIDVVRAIRAEGRTADLPVLVLTGEASQGDRNEAIESGADLFMMKPFSSFELIEQVRHLLTCRRRAA